MKRILESVIWSQYSGDADIAATVEKLPAECEGGGFVARHVLHFPKSRKVSRMKDHKFKDLTSRKNRSPLSASHRFQVTFQSRNGTIPEAQQTRKRTIPEKTSRLSGRTS